MINLPSKGIRLEDAEFYDKITKIETAIIDKLGELRKKRLSYECEHMNDLPKTCEAYNPQTDYFSKFWRMFLVIQLCKQKIGLYTDDLQGISAEIEKIENLLNKREDLRNQNLRLRPKSRRKAQQIQRNHICHYQQCGKAYGSELALKLHLKMKHLSYKSQNQIYE